jgi:molecular chaperone GrpE
MVFSRKKTVHIPVKNAEAKPPAPEAEPEAPAPASAPEAAAQQPQEQPGEVEALRGLLEVKTKEAEDYYDRLLRLAAETENFKKRQEKERTDLLQFANEKLIKELLPVVDNLERAIEHGRQGDAPAALLEGLELVHQGFLKALGQFGVSPIECLGQPFDPNFHNAVMQETTQEAPDRTVVKELQKGYLMHQRLLRPAMVAVAHNPENTTH